MDESATLSSYQSLKASTSNSGVAATPAAEMDVEAEIVIGRRSNEDMEGEGEGDREGEGETRSRRRREEEVEAPMEEVECYCYTACTPCILHHLSITASVAQIKAVLYPILLLSISLRLE